MIVSLSPIIMVQGNEIDGQTFLELTMDELNILLPNKLGIVKKLYRLIQSVNDEVHYYTILYYTIFTSTSIHSQCVCVCL